MKLYHLLKTVLFSLCSKRTVGVRILMIRNEHVLLVKHTYKSGWYTIGGAIDPKETPRVAIERELKEEVGVTLFVPPELFAVYYSNNKKRDDYIIFYIGHDCTEEVVKSPEIAESQWFPLGQLPQDVTRATRRRIDEYLGRREVEEHW